MKALPHSDSGRRALKHMVICKEAKRPIKLNSKLHSKAPAKCRTGFVASIEKDAPQLGWLGKKEARACRDGETAIRD
eukprot:CAMPEP_0179139566 /NCGR_PEP_ID=MMETSP0796-20121207/66766_1 /TAXON_ID=73915 /ORGANISM="Pyrodinium bahamense, Strain pbaha01" /LENGTH=76 /DNA_ID=CAMNT_0020839021 /DNA_START=29 /DNA_END=259 /DNA_ORIENTATION=+